MSEFSAELRAFDIVYNDMVHFSTPSSVRPLLVNHRLIDPSVDQGMRFLLPHESMEIMLRDVRNCIALDGTNSLKNLVGAFAAVQPPKAGEKIARLLKGKLHYDYRQFYYALPVFFYEQKITRS